MKLINVNDRDGDTYIINPIHVEEVKVTRSSHNNDWCIVISVGENRTHTILCHSESEKDNHLLEINAAMESIS